MHATLITQREYDHTAFEHDAEFVEGRIIERPMPTVPHSLMQAFLIFRLYSVGLVALPELRIRTKPDRTRIPDVCLVRRGYVATDAPYLCVEILSPDDSVVELRTKIAEYLALGVPYVWVIDPEILTGEIYTQTAIQRVTDGIFRAGDVTVDINAAPRCA